MSPLKHSNNIAARMGRWSASHWKTAVFGWLAFVVVAFGIGNAAAMKTIDTQDRTSARRTAPTRSSRSPASARPTPQTEIVLIQSKTLTVNDPAFRAAIADVATSVAPFATIKNLRSPLDPAHADQISDGRPHGDRRLGHEGQRHGRRRRTSTRSRGHRRRGEAASGPLRRRGRAASAPTRRSNAMFNEQLEQAGTRSVPLTLLILLLVFGSIVAAGVPLLLALTAVLATIGLLSLASQMLPMDQSVSGGRPADRPRRRRRLLALLPQARAGGACRRQRAIVPHSRLQPRPRAARCSSPGLTVMVAMAGLFFTRRQDVRLVRHRHDHGRRRSRCSAR